MSSKDLKPKLRFPQFKVAWTKTKLGEVTTKVEKRNRGKEILPVYSISNKYGFIHQSEQFEGMDSIERGFDTTQYKIVDNNTFAYNPARINVGSIGYNENLGVVLLSSLYVCFKTKDFIDDNFFWQFLNTNQFANEVSSKGEGGVRIYLFYENFATIKFVYPQIEEQQKIASFINAVDKKLNALIEKQNLLQEYKKGVMQKIFNRSIRFKDDKGNDFPEWEEKKLNEVFEFIPTNSFSRENLNYDTGKFKNIHYGDIHTKFKTHFSITNQIVPFINSDVKLKTNIESCFCKAGDVIFADASEDLQDVGKAIEIVNINREKLVAGLHTIHCRPTLYNLFVGFMGHLLQSQFVRLQIQKVAQGSKVLSISPTRIGQINLLIPSLEEQTQIANFLSAIDTKIENKQNNIAQTQQYKKGLMQQLFN